MSITKFQDLMFKRGCGNAVLILCAAVFVGGMFYNCGRSSAMNGPGDEKNKSPLVAKVGKFEVTDRDVTDAANESAKTLASQGITGFSAQMQSLATGLRQAVDQAATLYIAEKNNIQPKDEQILAAVKDANKQGIVRQLAQMGQIQPGATDAEIDAALKKVNKDLSLDTVLKRATDKVTEDLKDPSKRPGLAALASRQLLISAFAAKNPMSDEQMRAQFDTYVVKRILFSEQPGQKESADERAKKALDEITSNKITFEAAIDKYSNDHPLPSKKLSEITTTFSGATLDMQPEYKPLLNQKAGFVSPVISTDEGKIVFKIVSVKSDAPKDFAKNAANLKGAFSQNKANVELQKQTEALFKDGTVKWEAPGYEALYQVASARGTGDSLKKAYDKALAALQTNKGYDSRAAAMAAYVAQMMLSADPSIDKTKLLNDKILALQSLLANLEDTSLRLQLVDLAITKKDGPLATGQLLAAAQNNASFDAAGQKNFGDINAKADELVKAKLTTEAELKPLRDAQDLWRKNKADNDKMIEEAKKRDEESKKANAENDRKNAEALAKQKAEAAKAGASKPEAPKTDAGAPKK